MGNVQDVTSEEYVDSLGPTQDVASQRGGDVVNDVSTSLPTKPNQTHR